MKPLLLIYLLIFTTFSNSLLFASNTFQKDLSYETHNKRDPFLPLIGNNVAISNVALLNSIDDVRVEGILMDSAEGSVAVVNGQVLKEGNFIGGFEIVTIQPNLVIFRRDGEEFSIPYGFGEFRNDQNKNRMFQNSETL